jgi:hypothetical protein
MTIESIPFCLGSCSDIGQHFLNRASGERVTIPHQGTTGHALHDR